MSDDLSDILGEPAPPTEEPEVTFYPEPAGGWRGGDVVKESKKGKWRFAGYHPDGSIRFQFAVTPHFATPEGRKDINWAGTNTPKGKKPLYLVVREMLGHDGDKLVKFMFDVMTGQGEYGRASIRDRLTAAQWLSDRAFGKVKDTVVHENPDGSPLQPSQTAVIVPPAEIYAQLARVARALEAEDLSRGARSLPASLEGAVAPLPTHADGAAG